MQRQQHKQTSNDDETWAQSAFRIVGGRSNSDGCRLQRALEDAEWQEWVTSASAPPRLPRARLLSADVR